jgi:hypothetical protein
LVSAHSSGPSPLADAKGFVKEADESKPDFEFVTEYAAVLRVVRAQDLPPMDLNGKSDPYVVATIDGTTRRTRYIPTSLKCGSRTHIRSARVLHTPPTHLTLCVSCCVCACGVDCGPGFSPEWNEQFGFVLSSRPKNLTMKVFDYDAASKDDLIGECKLDLTPYLSPAKVPAAPAAAPDAKAAAAPAADAKAAPAPAAAAPAPAAAVGGAAGGAGPSGAAPAAANKIKTVFEDWIPLTNLCKKPARPSMLWIRFECHPITKARTPPPSRPHPLRCSRP